MYLRKRKIILLKRKETGETLDEMVRELPEEIQDRINVRAEELIAEERVLRGFPETE